MDARLMIIDGPPGIGCPVIAASSGADLALLVVEPTISGVHDLERILGTTGHFRVSALVLINKADLSSTPGEETRSFCALRGVQVVGEVPFDVVVTEAMVHGQPVTDHADGAVSRELERARIEVKQQLETGGER